MFPGCMTGFEQTIRQIRLAGCLADRAVQQMHRAGNLLFRNDDAAARQRGWQVEVRRAGLARRYRDPRFDGRTARPAAASDADGQ
jgi:hypothetical protein